MSTRSMIGIRNETGTITAIYCHWDGHPDTVGKVLKENFTDVAKIKDLMKLGNLSQLYPKLHPETKSHSYSTPEPGVTIAYRRDRKEKGQQAKTFYNFGEYMQYSLGLARFIYLYQDGKWLVSSGNEFKSL